MGHSAGHDVKLNTQDGYVKYNGRNLVIESTDIESWDLTHPMDGMTGIKPDLLKIKFNRIILNQDDRDWLKKDGLKKGESMYFKWDKKPEGQMWSGWCRSALKDTFPIDLKGTIDISGLGSLEVIVRISMNDPEEFKNFIEDVLDYYPSDEDCQTWINEGNTRAKTIDEAREYLHEIQQSDNEGNYKAKFNK